MHYLYFFALLFICQPIFAQQKTKVVLVATYHMAGTSDAVKVDVVKDDILNPERQKQLNKLLKVLAKYKAEKIYVENVPERQAYWDSIFADYLNGKEIINRSEIFQIGTKLTERLNLKHGVTCVDWQPGTVQFESEMYYKTYYEAVASIDESEDAGAQFTIYDEMTTTEIKNVFDAIPNQDLISVYKTLNADDFLKKLFYANISTYLDSNAERLGTFWAQNNMIRNVNIYSNIIRDILKDKPSTVIVLYGAGHIQSLKMLFETHPAIEVVTLNLK